MKETFCPLSGSVSSYLLGALQLEAQLVHLDPLKDFYLPLSLVHQNAQHPSLTPGN